MKIKGYPMGFVVLLSCMAWRVEAGTVIHQEEREPGGGQARQQVTLYLDAGKLRVEGENPGGGKYVVIFDKSKQTTWMADLSQGTYMEMTAEQIQAMSGQMQQMMEQMQERMEQMPPEQQQMMEQMMKQRMGGMGAPAVSVREKSRGENVGPFVCTRYEVVTGGQVSEEVCATPASELQLDASAYETFQALAEFYEPLRRQAPKSGWSVSSAMRQIEGFPVQTIVYEGQKPAWEWVVVKIEEQSLDAGLFTLPPGLKKSEMPRMQRPMMGR